MNYTVSEDHEDSGPFKWWLPGASTGQKVGVFVAIVGAVIFGIVATRIVYKRWIQQRELDDQEILGPNALKELFFSKSAQLLPCSCSKEEYDEELATHAATYGKPTKTKTGHRGNESVSGGSSGYSSELQLQAISRGKAAAYQPSRQHELGIPGVQVLPIAVQPPADNQPPETAVQQLASVDNLSNTLSTADALLLQHANWKSDPRNEANRVTDSISGKSEQGTDAPNGMLNPYSSEEIETAESPRSKIPAISPPGVQYGQPLAAFTSMAALQQHQAAMQHVMEMMCPGVPSVEHRLAAVLQEALGAYGHSVSASPDTSTLRGAGMQPATIGPGPLAAGMMRVPRATSDGGFLSSGAIPPPAYLPRLNILSATGTGPSSGPAATSEPGAELNSSNDASNAAPGREINNAEQPYSASNAAGQWPVATRPLTAREILTGVRNPSVNRTGSSAATASMQPYRGHQHIQLPVMQGGMPLLTPSGPLMPALSGSSSCNQHENTTNHSAAARTGASTPTDPGSYTQLRQVQHQADSVHRLASRTSPGTTQTSSDFLGLATDINSRPATQPTSLLLPTDRSPPFMTDVPTPNMTPQVPHSSVFTAMAAQAAVAAQLQGQLSDVTQPMRRRPPNKIPRPPHASHLQGSGSNPIPEHGPLQEKYSYSSQSREPSLTSTGTGLWANQIPQQPATFHGLGRERPSGTSMASGQPSTQHRAGRKAAEVLSTWDSFNKDNQEVMKDVIITKDANTLRDIDENPGTSAMHYRQDWEANQEPTSNLLSNDSPYSHNSGSADESPFQPPRQQLQEQLSHFQEYIKRADSVPPPQSSREDVTAATAPAYVLRPVASMTLDGPDKAAESTHNPHMLGNAAGTSPAGDSKDVFITESGIALEYDPQATLQHGLASWGEVSLRQESSLKPSASHVFHSWTELAAQYDRFDSSSQLDWSQAAVALNLNPASQSTAALPAAQPDIDDHTPSNPLYR